MKKIILLLFSLVALVGVQAQSLTTAKSNWTVIKNETVKGANTATRIGNAGISIVDAVRDTLGDLNYLPTGSLNSSTVLNYLDSKIYSNSLATPVKVNGQNAYSLITSGGTGFGTGTAFQIAGTSNGLYYRKTSTGEFSGAFTKLSDSSEVATGISTANYLYTTTLNSYSDIDNPMKNQRINYIIPENETGYDDFGYAKNFYVDTHFGNIADGEDSYIFQYGYTQSDIYRRVKIGSNSWSNWENIYINYTTFNQVNTSIKDSLEAHFFGYNDVNFAISSGKTGGANSPTWSTFTANTSAYTFAVNDYIDLGTIELPHNAIEGDTVEFHVHWANNGLDATQRAVKYQIFITYAYPDGGTHQFTAETSLSAETNIPANTPDKSAFYTKLGVIVDTNMKIGTQIKTRLKRIASTGTAPSSNPFVGQVGIHYKANSIGSSKINSK